MPKYRVYVATEIVTTEYDCIEVDAENAEDASDAVYVRGYDEVLDVELIDDSEPEID